MCGRIFIKSTIAELVQAFSWADPGEVSSLYNQFPRYNGAPRQWYPIIVADDQNRGTGGFVAAQWGLIPVWQKGPQTRPPPINARAEGISSNGLFRGPYKSKRCLVPIDGFFEWKDINSTGKNKQPYAIAMRDGSPFALAGIWDIWRDKETGSDLRTFCVITCEPNELMAMIHDRMPVIIDPKDYERWLSPEPDPYDLLKPFPAENMKMWPIGKKVGSPKNNTPDILDPFEV